MAYDTEYFQGKSVDEKHERAYWRRIGVVAFAVILGACLLAATLFAGRAYAAPRMQSGEECALAADMALVARSLAAASIARPKADEIMQLVYTPTSVRANDIIKAIMDTAYRNPTPPAEFPQMLLEQCMRTGGNLDGMLGTSI